MANFLKEVVCLLAEYRIPYIFNVEPDGSAYITFHEEIHSALKTIYCHNAIDPAIVCYMTSQPYLTQEQGIKRNLENFYSIEAFNESSTFRLLKNCVADYQMSQANEKIKRLFNI